MTDKLEYLKQLYDNFGDFELFYIKSYDIENRKATPGWDSWKKYSQCTDIERGLANLRSVFRQEVILDVEDPSRIDAILDELNSIPINYVAFETGSRGYHVHIIFKELVDISPSATETLKDRIISHFGCDITKKAERNLIALEYVPHFKTGKEKRIIGAKTGYVNNLEMFIAMTLKFAELKSTNPKFFDIYNGNWQSWFIGKSRSEAELSAVNTLAAFGFTKEQVWNLMDNCKIGKWKDETDNYKERTYKTSIESVGMKEIKESYTEPLFRFFEEYGKPEPITWLVPGYIPSKGVFVLAGAPGCGKSLVSEEMICAVSNGRKLFYGLEITQKRPVILIDMENDHSTLYDRLVKLGGIPSGQLLVFNFNYMFNVQNEFMVKELKERLEALNPCLIIFDTLRRTYWGDENNSQIINEVYRIILAPLSRRCCVMILAHTRKPSANKIVIDELSEIRGTGDITGIAAAVWMLKKNIDGTILVKPLKLRPAALPSSFLVGVEHSDTKIKFSYLNKQEDLITQLEELGNMLFEWLKHNLSSPAIVKTAAMKQAMKESGIDERRVTDAIAYLCNKNILTREKRGYYRFIYGNEQLDKYMEEPEVD